MTVGATRDDLLRVLAALYQRLGGEPAGVVDLRNALTFDLAWFTPTEAKIVLRAAESEGLLKAEGAGLRPSFDWHGLTLPSGYRPPKALVEWARRSGEPAAPAPERPTETRPETAAEHGLSLLERFVHRVAHATGETESLVRDRVVLQRRALGESVTPETAAMLVALGLGVDVRELVQELEAQLRAH